MSKYSVRPRERWRLQGQNRPRFTDHAVDQHDNRTPSWASSPETAYQEGVSLSHVRKLFTDKGGQTPDNPVFYAESRGREFYGVILLIRDGHVVTVYSLRSLPPAPRAFLETMAIVEDFV